VQGERRDRPHHEVVELLHRVFHEIVWQPHTIETVVSGEVEVRSSAGAVTDAKLELEITASGADHKRSSGRRLEARLDVVEPEVSDLVNAVWKVVAPDEYVDVVVWTRDSPVEQRVLRVSAEQKHRWIEEHESGNEVELSRGHVHPAIMRANL